MMRTIFTILFLRHSVLSIIISIIGLIVAGPQLVAGQNTADSERLVQAIKEAREELEAERTRIQHEIQALQTEQKHIEARAMKLASEAVERKLSLSEKQTRLETVRKRRADLRRESTVLDQQQNEIALIASDAQVKLADFLEILPPSENRAEQRQLLMKFRQGLTLTTENPDYILSLLSLLKSLYQESYSSAAFDSTIRDGRGYSHQAKILRLGHILHACQADDSRVIGLAVAGPDGEKGYRWKEDLPSRAAAEIAAVINSKQETSTILHLPIDITQGLTLERSYGSHAFWENLTAGGAVMIPLGLTAVLALFLIIERFWYLQRHGKARGAFAEIVLADCHAGDFDKALALTQTRRGIVPRVMKCCLEQRRRGIAVMEDSVQEAILHELPGLERFLSAISIMAGVAPLLGLLGTVTGMIATFNAITVFGSGQPRLMAGGISEALLTTAAGLIIAIPILFVHSFISSRVEGLIADMERFSATLINLINKESGDQDQATESGREQS